MKSVHWLLLMLSLACAPVASATAQTAAPAEATTESREPPVASSSAAVDFRTLDDIYRRLDQDLSADISYLDGGDNTDVLRTYVLKLEERADAGDRVAQFELAAVHLGNLHGQGDAGRAYHWLLTAAGPDHPLTQLAYGRFQLRISHEYRGFAGFERSNLYRAVSWMGPDSAAAIPTLERELHRESPSERSSIAFYLLKAGERGFDIVFAAFEGDDRDLRYAAIQGISQFSTSFDSKTLERVMPRLTAALDDEDPDVRRSAAGAINAIKNYEPTRKHREAGLPGDPPRPYGAKTPETAAKVKRLIGELNSPDAKVKKEAAKALERLKSEACTAVPDLLPLLKDPDKDVRHAAVDAIWFIGVGGVDVDTTGPLVAALDDKDFSVRSSACYALAAERKGAERAIPKLLKLLSDDGDGWSGPPSALTALAYRGHSKPIVAGLVDMLRSAKSPPANVIDTLQKIGRNAQAAIPLLEPLLKHDDAKIRLAAAQAIVKIGGGPTARAIALIRTEIRTDYGDRRSDAIGALSFLGPPAAPALPDLLALLEDPGREAVAAFRRAAEQGDADAQFELGLALREGLDGVPDPRAAETWIRRAAEQGHAGAQRRLAIMYRQGSVVRRDEGAAEAWYRKAVVPRVLQRITRPGLGEKEFRAALAPHTDPFWNVEPTSEGQARMSLVTIGRIGTDKRELRHVQILSDGSRHGWEVAADPLMPETTGPISIEPLDLTVRDELLTLLKELPAGVGYVPVEQRIVFSRMHGGVWKTEQYDSAALPPKVRLILFHARLLDDRFEPDPRLAPIVVRSATPLLRDISFRPDGALLMLGDESRIRAWRDGRELKSDGQSSPGALDDLPGSPLGISPEGERVVVYERRFYDAKLQLYDARARRVVAELGKADSFYIPGIKAAFSSDGTTFVPPNNFDKEHELRSAATGEVLAKFAGTERKTAALSADGKLAAVRIEDYRVNLIDTASGFAIKEYSGHAAAFTRDGRQLAVLAKEELTLYEPATGELRVVPLALDRDDVGPIVYSPDGRFLACVYAHDRIAIVDVGARRVVGLAGPHFRRDPRKPKSEAYSTLADIEFSPDGKQLATASSDGVIKLWNMQEIRREE